MLADGDPIALSLFNRYQQVQMPNLHLGGADVEAVLSYLEQQNKAQEAPVARQEAGHHHHH